MGIRMKAFAVRSGEPDKNGMVFPDELLQEGEQVPVTYKTHPVGVATAHRGKPRKVTKWRPTWYKPWTWLHFQTYYVVDTMDFFDISLVKHPPEDSEIQKEVIEEMYRYLHHNPNDPPGRK